ISHSTWGTPTKRLFRVHSSAGAAWPRNSGERSWQCNSQTAYDRRPSEPRNAALPLPRGRLLSSPNHLEEYSMLRITTFIAGLALSAGAFALSLSDLSQGDANAGLKDALSQGARVAVQQLGKPGGFSNDP